MQLDVSIKRIWRVNTTVDAFEYFQEEAGKSRDGPHLSPTSPICRMTLDSISDNGAFFCTCAGKGSREVFFSPLYFIFHSVLFILLHMQFENVDYCSWESLLLWLQTACNFEKSKNTVRSFSSWYADELQIYLYKPKIFKMMKFVSHCFNVFQTFLNDYKTLVSAFEKLANENFEGQTTFKEKYLLTY